MAHWIDNADSYICSCCGHEVNNPNMTPRYGAGRCPRCFAEMDWLPQSPDYPIIGIAYAMEKEAQSIIGERYKVDTIAGVPVYQMFKNVYAFICGVGKVNAAMGTQAFIQRYKPTRIINVGTAGSFQKFPLGTIVLATDFVQHDVDTSVLGDPVGLVSTVDKIEFQTDDIHLFETGLQKLGTPYIKGRVVTGDVFMTPDKVKAIDKNFSPILCEMEGGAIAQVCLRNEVKFASLKTITDRVLMDGHTKEYEANVIPLSETRNWTLLQLLEVLNWVE